MTQTATQNRGGGRGERRGRDDRRGGQREEKNQYLERVVTINRVSKVVKGGRRFSFTALVVVGDGKGMVGVGYGKAKEVPAAIAKGVEVAKKSFFSVPLIQGTIPHPVQGEKAAGVAMLRPASPGTGVIAGGAMRAVLECAGITDVLAKSLGSPNVINVVQATVEALQMLEDPHAVARRRTRPVEDVAPAALLRAQQGKVDESGDAIVEAVNEKAEAKADKPEVDAKPSDIKVGDMKAGLDSSNEEKAEKAETESKKADEKKADDKKADEKKADDKKADDTKGGE